MSPHFAIKSKFEEIMDLNLIVQYIIIPQNDIIMKLFKGIKNSPFFEPNKNFYKAPSLWVACPCMKNISGL